MGRRETIWGWRRKLKSRRSLGWNLLPAATLGILFSRCALLAAQPYGELPLAFEANRGQWGSQVKFAARGEGYTIFLTAGAAVLVFPMPPADAGPRPQTGHWKLGTRHPKIETRQSEIQNPKSKTQPFAPRAFSVLRLTFPNTDPQARLTGLAELPGKAHYLVGSDPRDWLTGVSRYERVRYERIFPGVDLIFYGRGRRLEFDFVVAPGADPAAIRFAVETRESKIDLRKSWSETSKPRIGLAGDGDLFIATDGGEIRLCKPKVYQEKASVVSDQLSVAEGYEQRTAKPLNLQSQTQHREWIDARYVVRRVEDETGKAKNEIRKSTPEDQESKIGDSPFTIHHAKYEVGFDIAAYDPTRPLVIDPVLSYSTYLGGTGLDYAEGIAVDATGSAYVVGYTNSTDFPLAHPAQETGGGGVCGSGLDLYPCPDVFVAKLNAAGTALEYSTYIGGGGEDFGMGIAVDASGNAYVTGYTNSPDFPLAGSLQPSLRGGYDAFVVKLNAQGSALENSTNLGGSGDDYGYGIALAPGGEVWLTGFTSSTNFPTTPGAVRGAYGGGPYDAFVSRLDLAGATLAYSTYLGGSGEDYASAIAADAAGNAYVTGYTNSADFPTAGAFQSTYAGGVCGVDPSTFPCYGAFVTKLSSESGALAYSTYLGGRGSDYGYGIAVDGNGKAVVAGATTSTDFPVSAGALKTAGGGASVDAFVTKLDASGASTLYSTYLGGLGVAVDDNGNVYVTGYNLGGGFPLTNPLQAASGGHYDAFLAKLNDAGTALVFSTYLGGSGQDKGNAVALDSSGYAYVAGGTFSTDFPVTAGAFQTAYAGGSFEGFVAKMADLGRPVVAPSEASLTFADQGVATTSAAQRVSFANSGDAELLIGGISSSGDFAQTNDCPGSLAPGESCAMEITFSPTQLGPRTGSVSVAHNAAGSPFVVHLDGNGVAAPALEISPASLSFGEQSLGTMSPGQTVTLRNTGAAVLSFSSISIGEDFAETNTCGPSLAVGSVCSVTVSFAPLTPGTIAGALAIVDNAPGSPHVIALSGTGLGPAVSLSPAILVFGRQVVETTSSPQTVLLTNSGNAPLNILGIEASGDFAQTNNCPGSVAAGGQCAISVTFRPASACSQTGTLAITHNPTSESFTVPLSGMATDFSVSASPNSATIRAGEIATYSISLNPMAGFSGRVSLACGGAPQAATCTVTPAEVSVNGTGSATAVVTVRTTASSASPPGPRGRGKEDPTGLLEYVVKQLWFSLLAFLALAGWAGRRRTRWALGGVFLSAALWTACGGGGAASAPASKPGTPAGDYTLSVTATSEGISRSATVSLRVN
jgi:hypothetical protein